MFKLRHVLLQNFQSHINVVNISTTMYTNSVFQQSHSIAVSYFRTPLKYPVNKFKLFKVAVGDGATATNSVVQVQGNGNAHRYFLA